MRNRETLADYGDAIAVNPDEVDYGVPMAKEVFKCTSAHCQA